MLHSFTKEQLAAALKAWENDSATGDWAARDDEQRFDDSADYLIAKMQEVS